MTSSGIRYSNIDALHESSARELPARRQRSPELEPVLVRDLAGRDRQEARQPRFGGEGVVVRGVEPAVGDVEADREQLPLGVEEEAELGLLDQVVGERRRAARRARSAPRRRRGALDRAARVAGDARSRVDASSAAIAPGDELGQARARAPAAAIAARLPSTARVQPVSRSSSDPDAPTTAAAARSSQYGRFGQRTGGASGWPASSGSSSSCSRTPSADSRSPICGSSVAPLGRASPARSASCARRPPSSVDRRAAPSPRPIAAAASSFVLEQVDGVLERRRARRVDDRRAFGELGQAGAQRQQVAGEVAAVDRRDVGRRQRRQRPRVVPVVEVAAIALHAQQRVERRLEPIEQAGEA